MRPDPNYPTPKPNQQVARIGGENSTTPAWYLVDFPSDGPVEFTVKVILDDNDRQAIAGGADIELTLFGAEVPWHVAVTDER